ncbi:MAG: tetratricopeptide repeat protein, partial [Anaerolineae bacterium]|nr:tetratricopeptide repeat protein [Anaerolineae bacterium]
QQAALYDRANPSIYVELARVQIFAGQYEAAETSAQNALLLNSDYPRALAYYGWALSSLGKDQEAEQILLLAIEKDPSSAEANAFYAELLADQEDYAGAGDFSRRAMELNPGLFEVRLARGYVLERTDNYDQALAEYQAAMVINSKIAELHLSLGRVYWAQQRFQEAIDAFNSAANLNPEDPLPHAYLSRIFTQIGEYGKAMQAAQKAVENDPTNPVRYGRWGAALFNNDLYLDAADAFSIAVHGGVTEDNQVVTGLPLNYETAEFYALYGLALARSQQCGQAIPVFRDILAGVPADEIAVYNANVGLDICRSNPGSAPTETPTEEGGLAARMALR